MLKILDRGGRAYFTNAIVADWFVHDRGLTGDVQRRHSMKHDIETLLEVISSVVGDASRELVVRVQEALGTAPVQSFDEYVDWVAKLLRGRGD